MDGRCTECGCNNVALHHYLDHLCYDCYEKMFKEYEKNNPIVKIDVDEEPDFELKHDVAVVDSKSMHLDSTYFVTSDKIYSIKMPKRMIFDSDCRVKDYDKLIKFILDNMHITENNIGFDKVRYMFKEDDR
jgi:hypothetical protein